MPPKRKQSTSLFPFPRRRFLQGVGAGAAAVALAPEVARAQLQIEEEIAGQPRVAIRLRINGRTYRLNVEPRETVLEPNEVVEEISVPTPAANARGVYLKVRERSTWDFSTLSVVALVEMDGAVCRRARVVLGPVAPVPWPAPEADKVLAGARITLAVARQAAEAALRGARAMSHNAYKIPLAKNLVRRAILQAAGLET